MASAMVPMAGPQAAQAMQLASSALYGIYTIAIQAGFAEYKDENRMLRATLGELQEDSHSIWSNCIASSWGMHVILLARSLGSDCHRSAGQQHQHLLPLSSCAASIDMPDPYEPNLTLSPSCHLLMHLLKRILRQT